MSDYDPVDRLGLEFSRLPGIGARAAARLAFYLIKSARDDEQRGHQSTLATDLADALSTAVEQTQLCARCRNLCLAELCAICTDARRQPSICVVESVLDLRAMERSASFSGSYFVLHGAIAPLDGVGPNEVGLPLLKERCVTEGPEEVLIATNANVEGDTTALYIARLLKAHNLRLTRLASGVPLGGELEYIDQATLGRAVQNRQEM